MSHFLRHRTHKSTNLLLLVEFKNVSHMIEITESVGVNKASSMYTRTQRHSDRDEFSRDMELISPISRLCLGNGNAGKNLDHIRIRLVYGREVIHGSGAIRH